MGISLFYLNLPYLFTFNPLENNWAITYDTSKVDNGKLTELYVDPETQQLKITDQKSYEFELHYFENTQMFSINSNAQLSSNDYHPLVSLPVDANNRAYFNRSLDISKFVGFSADPYIFKIEDLYAGKRENIIPIAKIITQMDPIQENKTAHYLDLILQMGYNNHFPGKEVFVVGHYVYVDAKDSYPFQRLPEAVRVICASFDHPIRPFYLNSSSMHLHPMRFEYSEPKPNLNFAYWLTMNPENNNTWSFTYDRELNGYREELFVHPETQQLYRTSYTHRKTYEFQLYLEDDTRFFNIYSNGNDTSNPFLPLVGVPHASVQDRISFNRSSNTTAKPARFYPMVYELNAEEIYQEVYIMEIADFIERSKAVPDKVDAYTKIVQIMIRKNHLPGKRVFDIGGHFAKYNWTEPLALLPEVVQTVYSGGPLQFGYRSEIEGGVDYSMKYALASDLHENILPYTFQQSVSIVNFFSITYGSDYQILKDENGNIVDVQTPWKSPLYEFYLQSDLTHFRIYYTVFPTGYVGTDNLAPDFYFNTRVNVTKNALFYVKPY
jgi:hypothetical protein